MNLKIDNLSYSYGRTQVLRDIAANFEVGATVLLGPNGAGKSTLLELIASLRKPQSGSIEIEGVARSDSRGAKLATYRRTVAWLPQKFVPYPGLRVREHVAYAGWLKGLSKTLAWDQASRALDLVDLGSRASDPVKRLSGGQQKRVGIAGALVHDAKVVLLDEPTAGLDPAQRKKFRDVLELVAENRTVVVSSHDADDAHSKFGRVAVLRAGQLIFLGSMTRFVERTPSELDARDRVEHAYTTLVGAEE